MKVKSIVVYVGILNCFICWFNIWFFLVMFVIFIFRKWYLNFMIGNNLFNRILIKKCEVDIIYIYGKYCCFVVKS